MTAVDMLDDDTFLGAEDHYNLFTVRKNSEAPSDEERYRLQTVGQYHLGEFVNKFVRGSLVVQPREGEKEGGTSSIEKAEKDGQIEGASTPSKAGGGKEGGRERGVSSTTAGGSGTGLLFGTQQGMVGSILPLSEEDYRFFRALTKAINKVVKGVGGFSHDEYRRFLTEKTVSDAHSFIDGDLIESFLDLSKQGMEEVVMLMRAEGVGGEGGGGVRGKKKGEEEEGVAGGKDVGGMEVVEEDQGGGKEAGREAGKQEGGLLMVEEVYRRVEDMMRLH
ncbi:dna damage-binding protein 1a-like [Nannochloropsis oceanica]